MKDIRTNRTALAKTATDQHLLKHNKSVALWISTLKIQNCKTKRHYTIRNRYRDWLFPSPINLANFISFKIIISQ